MILKSKILLVLSLIFSVALVLSSCADNVHRKPIVSESEYPTRIISMSPGTTETLFALGLDDEIIGVTDYCTYPPAALSRVKLGGLFDPNIESLITLAPDLVVIIPALDESIGETFDELGIVKFTITNETLVDIYNSFITLGEATGRKKEGKALADNFKAVLDSFSSKHVDETPVRTMIVVGRNPGTMQGIYVAGKETFYTELLGKAGAINIFGDVNIRYPQPSIEEIILRNPEVIIELRAGETFSEEKQLLLKKEWAQLGDIAAVTDEKVYLYTESYIAVPGPRLIKLLEDFDRDIHARQVR